MLLLSGGQPAPAEGGSCAGWYTTQHAALRDSARPGLGLGPCMPFPTWLEPGAAANAALLGVEQADGGRVCPGGAAPVAPCAEDVCKPATCGNGPAVGCVAKLCPGRLMFGGTIQPPETCVPASFSSWTGLPMDCSAMAQVRICVHTRYKHLLPRTGLPAAIGVRSFLGILRSKQQPQ